MVLIFISLCLGFLPSACGVRFTLNDCSHSSNKVLRINYMHISSDPVRIPGQETVDGAVEILRPVSGNHLRLDVVIEKHVMFVGHMDLVVPCISNVGSCSYDLCTLLSQFKLANGSSHCPIQLEQSNFPCACPFQPGHYWLNPATFQIPAVTGLWSFLASGRHFEQRYDVTVRLPYTNALSDHGNDLIFKADQRYIGDYKIHVKLVDTTISEEVGCYDLQVTVDSKCSGLSCIIG